MLLLSCCGGVCGGVRPARPEGHGRPAGRSRGWRGRRSGGAAAADTAGEALPRTGPADWRLGRLSQRPDSLSPPPADADTNANASNEAEPGAAEQTGRRRRSGRGPHTARRTARTGSEAPGKARPTGPHTATRPGRSQPTEPHTPTARPRPDTAHRTAHRQPGHGPPGTRARALSVGRGARGQARRGRVEVRATSSGGRTMRWWWCAAGAVVSSMRSSAAMRPMRRAGRRTEVRGTAAAAANSMSS